MVAPSGEPDRVSRNRYTRAVVIALAVVSIPYLWILWDLWTGSADPLRVVLPANFYDLQARALIAGHLWVPNGSLGIEAFVHDGRQYTYFGLFPALLRMPILAVTHRFDGRLTAPSLLLAWMVTGLGASLLLWRVRILGRGSDLVGRGEAVCCGVLVATVTGGSVLMYLAASPKVTHEDVAWSVALTIVTVFALLGVLEHPSGRRVLASGVLVLLTSLDRSPTGYACEIAALLIAGWYLLGRGGADRRRWVLPMAAVGLVPLVVSGLFNWAKLGMPFGLSEADQVWTHVNAHRRAYLKANGGNAFGLRYLPSTLLAYLQPGGISISSAFPYLALPTTPARAVGSVVLDQTYPTASITASMPLAFLLGCWGLVAAFRRRSIGRIGVTRLLLVATAAGTVGVLLFGYISDRYLADLLPFVALAGMIGLVDLWRRIVGWQRRSRVAVVVVISALGLFGLWANVGAALTPTALWTTTQAQAFVNDQLQLGATPPVESGDRLPYFAPAGTLFVANDCSGVYVSTGFSYATVPGQQLQHQTWIPVEQGAGINHVIQVEFNRPVRPTDPPITLMTYGRTTVRVLPTGFDQVRLVVDDAGAASVTWPPASTGTLTVRPQVRYRVSAMTDPNLQSIVVGGLGGGLGHYLAGTGPAVVAVSGTGDPTAAATVTEVTQPIASVPLCRRLLSSH